MFTAPINALRCVCVPPDRRMKVCVCVCCRRAARCVAWLPVSAASEGTAYVIEEPTGRGHVVLYAEDPNFRAIWRSTTRLFFNSFLFQPIF